MPGRHAATRRRRRWPRRLVVTLVALVALGAGAYFARDYFIDDAQASCEGSLPVSIAAAPAIEPVVTEILGRYEGDPDMAVEGTCITVEVAAESPAAVAANLSGDVHPDIWIPDSSMWMQQLTSSGVSLGEATSLAVSSLVVVATEPIAKAQLGWPDADISWAGLLENAGAATIPDPLTSTEGLATLLAVRSVVGDSEESRTQLVQAMTAVSEAAVPDVGTAYGAVRSDPTTAPLFTAAEQSVVAHNQQHPANLVVALYPAEGTFAFDYPAIPIEGRETTVETTRAVGQLVEALQTETAVTALQEAGFRTVDGVARENAFVRGIQVQMPTVMPSPDPAVAGQLRQQWAALSLEMHMLAVIDVSGSMVDTDGGEQTRAELVRDAAAAALDLIPQSGSVGVWLFSSFESDQSHWEELVEVGPLAEEVGGVVRKEALVAATREIPTRVEANVSDAVRGWTALYPTALAAFNEVKAGYQPGKVNSVVLLTDGRDEWPEGTDPEMTLDQLLDALRAGYDPARPVHVITIGIGPDADGPALRAISEATNGTHHIARDPSDIRQVFLEAMVARQER
ncbi:MAG TPA: substrate-binding and VWA domain-containing protein [Jiangellaceae bacterium]